MKGGIIMKTHVTILMVMTVSFCFVSECLSQDKTSMEAPLVLPNSTEAMQRPGFWINRLNNPDRVIMTPEQIAEMNIGNRNRPEVIDDIDGNPFSIEKTVLYKDHSIGAMFRTEDPLDDLEFSG